MRRLTVGLTFCLGLFSIASTSTGEENINAALRQAPPAEQALYRRQLLQLDRVARRLLQAIPERPRIKFVLVPNESSINAGATFGQVMVTGGMMEFVQSDDELAMILGHELAHITQGHVTRGAFSNMALGVGAVIADILVPSSGQLAGTVGQLFLNRYNQGQEREADEVGLRYAFNAGFDPSAGPQVMGRMAREVPQTASSGFFSSHPGSIERAEALRRLAATLGGRPEESRLAHTESTRRSWLERDEEACQRAKTYFYQAKDMVDLNEKVFLYQRGLRICPQSPRAHSELADAYAELGETRAAMAELREVLRYDPDYPNAQERLRVLQGYRSRGEPFGSFDFALDKLHTSNVAGQTVSSR